MNSFKQRDEMINNEFLHGRVQCVNLEIEKKYNVANKTNDGLPENYRNRNQRVTSRLNSAHFCNIL